MNSNLSLVEYLKKIEALRTPRIIEAFEKVDRIDFVLPQDEKHAYANVPLRIGHGQTISQPLTVAFMLERLQPKKGDKVLDIGSGSGWTTALLSHIVGPKGQVTGLEIIEDLVEFGRNNIKKYSLKNAEIKKAEKGVLGMPGEKFDRILVSASATEFPDELLEQLDNKGSMMVPVKSSLYQVQKDKEGHVDKKEIPGFVFVPLV